MTEYLNRKRGEAGPDFDPVNLMHQIFEDAATFIGPAQDVLLSWLMKLPQSVEPAAAAKTVLDTTVAHCRDTPSEEARKLIELLVQVSDHGAIGTVDMPQKRRRGGRAARTIQ